MIRLNYVTTIGIKMIVQSLSNVVQIVQSRVILLVVFVTFVTFVTSLTLMRIRLNYFGARRPSTKFKIKTTKSQEHTTPTVHIINDRIGVERQVSPFHPFPYIALLE